MNSVLSKSESVKILTLTVPVFSIFSYFTLTNRRVLGVGTE